MSQIHVEVLKSYWSNDCWKQEVFFWFWYLLLVNVGLCYQVRKDKTDFEDIRKSMDLKKKKKRILNSWFSLQLYLMHKLHRGEKSWKARGVIKSLVLHDWKRYILKISIAREKSIWFKLYQLWCCQIHFLNIFILKRFSELFSSANRSESQLPTWVLIFSSYWGMHSCILFFYHYPFQLPHQV